MFFTPVSDALQEFKMNANAEKRHEEDVTTTTIIPQEWKTKRRHTFATFLLNRFIQGLEFTMIASTLLSYVENGLLTSNTNLFYGLIAGARTLAAITMTVFVSRWYDKHQRLKCFTLLVSTLMNVGYALYGVHLSPYLPMLGSIFFGSAVLLGSVINSEIHLVYADDDIQQMFILIMLVYSVGDLLGPVLVKLLDKVDFWIGNLHIMYGNVSCLVLLSANTLRLILSCFFTHDLSREFNLKSALSPAEKAMSSKAPWLATIRRSLGPDAIYLYVRQLFTQFFFVYQIRVLPLIIRHLRYSNLFLDVCFILTSVLMTIICLVMKVLRPTSKGVFNFGVLSLLCIFVSNVLYLLVGRGYGDVVDIFIIFALVFIYACAWTTDTSFIVATLGKLFPSSVQTSAEGARMIIQVAGEFLGSFTSVYVFACFDYVAPVLILVAVCMLVVMFVRKEFLRNPCVQKDEGYSLIDEEKKRSKYRTTDV